MRILLVRHGDPDYDTDSLTEQGVREAKALAACADTLLRPDACYVSPLGRARQTASYTLEALGMKAETKEWLQEFPARVRTEEDPEEFRAAYHVKTGPDGSPLPRIVWDLYPAYYASHPELADRSAWRESAIARHSDITECYDRVTAGLDELLAEHGYVREGDRYRTASPNRERIVMFCHFGVTCVMLSHLMNVSPFVLLQSTCILPTGVTEIATEERQQGIVSLRTLRIGDLTHLALAGVKPSFSARFCETFDSDERH